jgi:hypothetical protein
MDAMNTIAAMKPLGTDGCILFRFVKEALALTSGAHVFKDFAFVDWWKAIAVILTGAFALLSLLTERRAVSLFGQIDPGYL